MDCNYQPDGDGVTCTRCGDRRPARRRRNCPAAPGLGDRVAALLKRLGLRPCGGCRRRQRLLNQLGDSLAALVRRR